MRLISFHYRWWLPGITFLFFTVAVFGSGTFIPSGGVPDKSKVDIRRGEKLFKKKRLGKGDTRNCLACHARDVPIRKGSFAEREEELMKQVHWCLTTRVKNQKINPGSKKFNSLIKYIKHTYGVDIILEQENPDGLDALIKAQELFADGDFELSLLQYQTALAALKLKGNIVLAHFEMGVLNYTLGDSKGAKAAFRESLTVDPGFKPDENLYPPKVITLFYGVKRTVKR